jgi:hypothetical protein
MLLSFEGLLAGLAHSLLQVLCQPVFGMKATEK